MSTNKMQFVACLSRGDKEYHWGFYKTFGGARRCIRRQLMMYRPEHQQFDGWAIERRETVLTPETKLGFHFGLKSCLIAQSRNWKFNLTVKRREL